MNLKGRVLYNGEAVSELGFVGGKDCLVKRTDGDLGNDDTMDCGSGVTFDPLLDCLLIEVVIDLGMVNGFIFLGLVGYGFGLEGFLFLNSALLVSFV